MKVKLLIEITRGRKRQSPTEPDDRGAAVTTPTPSYWDNNITEQRMRGELDEQR